MRKSYVVEQYVTVEVDESKFTPEFMAEFRRYFYPSFTTVEDHMAFFARLYVSGSEGPLSTFIEGYGNPADFGIKWQEDSEMIATEE